MRKHYLYLFAALLLSTIVIAIASREKSSFYVSAEPRPSVFVSQTTHSSTYVSTKGKFSITYPSDLTIHVNFVHVQNSNQYHPVANVIELDSPAHKKAPYVLIHYGEKLVPETVEEYISNSSECEDVETKKGEVVTVGGVDALLFKNIHCSGTGETRVYFINGKKQYNIIINGSPVDETFLKNFLSMFQLIDS